MPYHGNGGRTTTRRCCTSCRVISSTQKFTNDRQPPPVKDSHRGQKAQSWRGNHRLASRLIAIRSTVDYSVATSIRSQKPYNNSVQTMSPQKYFVVRASSLVLRAETQGPMLPVTVSRRERKYIEQTSTAVFGATRKTARDLTCGRHPVRCSFNHRSSTPKKQMDDACVTASRNTYNRTVMIGEQE